MLKKFSDYQEKIQYAKELMAVFTADKRFKNMFAKSSSFPDKGFQALIKNDGEIANDISHLYSSGKDIFETLSSIASLGSAELTDANKEAIDKAYEKLTDSFSELYNDGKTPSEKMSSYMQATNNTKVSKGTLPFVYGLASSLEKLNYTIKRDCGKQYFEELQGMDTVKENDKKIAIDCAKQISDFAAKYKLDSKSLLALTNKNEYLEAAKKVYASNFDLNKITDPAERNNLKNNIDKAIQLELEDSELQRTEKAINDADLNILIGTYENYVKDVERFKIFSQSSTQKDNEVHRMEYEINKARALLSSKRQGLGDVMIAEYQNKVGELNNDIAKIGEFMRISASMAANKNGEVSPDYTEKVKEMTELCERLSGQKNLSPAKQNEILRAQHAKLTDELSDFKKRDENKKYAEYDKEEKAFTKLKADYANAKKGRSEMAKEYSEQLSTVNYKKNFYQIELNKICDAYGIKHLGHSQSIEDHAKILTQLQNAKTKILADSHNREQEIRMQLSNIGNDMYKCAQKYGADIGGMSSFFKKRESVFNELNNVRNSGTILKDKLPEIKAREKDIYDAGIDIQIDVPTDQLKSMLDKLSVFMPDPDKKGNSKEYMAMHEAIQKAKALYESGEDISREAHIKAAKDIKEAANKYLDAKSHQIRFWPFSSNQRYARILNAQSLASAAEKMEEIANSISPIEAQYNKLMGPSGKYNVNNPKYEENLLTDIFDKAKQQKQPEKTNELEAKEQQNVMQ